MTNNTLSIYWLLKWLLVCAIFFSGNRISTAQKTAETKPFVKVKILSWNIQMLPNALAIFSKALRKKQAIREPWIVEHCLAQQYDVIVFQEAFDLDIKRKLKRHLKEMYPYQVGTKTNKGRLTSNGIYIFSRHPMKDVDHVIYKKGAHEDRWAAKGCTLVELEKEGVKFHVAGTHLQSGSSEAAVMHRSLQYQDVCNLLDSNKIDTIPVFLVGDMNTEKGELNKYREMTSVMKIRDIPLDDPEPYTVDNKNSWTPQNKAAQIDYIFDQPRQTNSRIMQQKILRLKHELKGKMIDLADHYGLVGVLEISNKKIVYKTEVPKKSF